MLEVIRDKNGNIKAVIEYYVVDEIGNFSPNGVYVWINEFEISKSHQGNGILNISREFYKRITKAVPKVQFGYYWRRRKYGDNAKIKLLSIRQWTRLLGGRDEKTSS